MINFQSLVSEYMIRFPNVSRADHFMIIQGALGGGEMANMTQKGFRRWYNEVGRYLNQDPNGTRDIIGFIKENPHGNLQREVMILGDDWDGVSILDDLRDRYSNVA
jgi:hypothetical protein